MEQVMANVGDWMALDWKYKRMLMLWNRHGMKPDSRRRKKSKREERNGYYWKAPLTLATPPMLYHTQM